MKGSALMGGIALMVAVAGGASMALALPDGPGTPARTDHAAPRHGALSISPPSRALVQDGEGPAYDGRFTFLRLRWDGGGGSMRDGFFDRGRGRREPPWAHDMPRAERNFARILEATTSVDPYMEGGRVLDVDDPELFRYAVAYIVEVGGWRPSASEVEALRAYLLKGGFLIVDDFRGYDINRFIGVMGQVLPGAEVMEIPVDHEVWDSFFHIEDPAALVPPTFQQYVPIYLGIFEDNDPTGRLMAVINYNNDIAEYWEYSDRGYYPIDLSNEAYKFGVNYVVYALTH